MSPVTEVELKFQVPASAWRAVEAAVARAASQRTRLEAAYFDTPDWRLAAAGIALRLRKEGRRRVQTAKAAGADAMQRLEHNVPIGGRFGAAIDRLAGADPLRHAGTPVGERLAAALAPRPDEAQAPTLVEQYRSVVWRRHRPLRVEGGVVELALDRGELVAGGRREPVCELEIELLRGDPRAVIATATRWVRRHGVWLDVRSKSERGVRLARGIVRGPVVKASAVTLDRAMGADDALRAVIASCLRQILPNASEVAADAAAEAAHAGSALRRTASDARAETVAECETQSGEKNDAARDDGIAGHVHQLRVGLRRLRSALRFFDGWTTPLDAQAVESLTSLFRQLGAARDRDALAASLMPELQAAGAPRFALPAAPPGPTPGELVRAPAATLALLSVLAFQLDGAPPQSPAAAGEGVPDDANAPQPTLAEAVSRRLERWHRRIVRSAQHYDTLSDDERHRLRKRVKRQRYAAEFVAALFPAGAVARYLAQLAPLQEVLGHYNDVCVGLEMYRTAVGEDARAWFAIGWLTARRDVLLADSAKALARFSQSEPFWDKRVRRPKPKARDGGAMPGG